MSHLGDRPDWLSAAVPRLIRSNCGAPGIARRRRGRGFEYIDPDGQHIDDPEMLERIAALTIPPAWREVWICMDPRGHLQATGLDGAGRKQYLYHEHWRSHRDRQKFDSMLAFGDALPRLRRRIARDLRPARKRQSGWLAPADLSTPVVLACSVRLLDLGFFRIGSEHYAERNESYGLTTMLRRHVTIDKGEVVFDFPAKSGQRRIQAIADDEVMRILVALKRRRSGTQLLAYHDADERWVEVNAEEVNDYIKRHAGGEFTAKDFRTWNASVLAAVALAGHERPASRAQRERKVRAAIETVASYLGNTPAVCRASYVDPRVIDRYHAGVTIAATLADLPAAGPDLSKPSTRKRIESAVIDLLAEYSPSARRAA
jgi:DNA topoisomerase I